MNRGLRAVVRPDQNGHAEVGRPPDEHQQPGGHRDPPPTAAGSLRLRARRNGLLRPRWPRGGKRRGSVLVGLRQRAVGGHRLDRALLGAGQQAGQVAAGGERDQKIGHLGRGGGAVLGRLGQHPLDQLDQFVGQVAAELPDRRGGLLDVGHHLVEGARELRPAKRRLPGQQLVERAAQAVDVRADVHAVYVGDLFGGHVVGRAHRLVGGRHLLALGPLGLLHLESGQAQIEHLDDPLGREH